MLEHVNVTVRDPMVTAKRFAELFGWKIRWQGEAIDNGYSVHVGTDDHYIAFYAPAGHVVDSGDTYTTEGGLNHIGVVVDDLDAVAAKVTALGYALHSFGAYEPGRRFYFDDADNIEVEVVSYR